MRTLAVLCIVVLGSLTPAIVHAQASHAAPQATIDRALRQRADDADARRDRVRQLLARPDLRAIAGRLGLDLRQAESAVATLEGDRLAEADAQAAQVKQSLAGGANSVTISTTTIII